MQCQVQCHNYIILSLETPKMTLEEVTAQAGIDKLDILDQECCQELLPSLVKHCHSSVDWQLICFHLGLTKTEVVAVGDDSQTPEQKRVEVLGKWKEKFSSKATYRAFIEALLSCGKALDAIEACKAIKSSNGVKSSMHVLFIANLLLADLEVPADHKKQIASMSDEEFFKWLRLRGISEKDCKTLAGIVMVTVIVVYNCY